MCEKTEGFSAKAILRGLHKVETKVIKIKEENINWQYIEEAGAIIRAGGLVAFPTETVYGL
ncbi:MAG: hypothetical protein K2N55_06210, partial [Lachnospiraceae bacterium]|nr:hypothetical protein [Lachnospiraceae bacterium]